MQAHADGRLDDALTKWSHRFDENLMEVLEDEQRLETAELVGRTRLVATISALHCHIPRFHMSCIAPPFAHMLVSSWVSSMETVRTDYTYSQSLHR